MQRFPLGTLAAALASLTGCSSYQPAQYSGDGTMYAMPRGSPRYDLELEPVSLMRPGRAEFQLADLPTTNLLAFLSINDPTPDLLNQIDKTGVRVRMTLIDHARAHTSVKSGRLLGDWAPTPESWAEAPAEYEGVWFRAPRHARFTLTIDVFVDHPAANPPAINATPHIRG